MINKIKALAKAMDNVCQRIDIINHNMAKEVIQLLEIYGYRIVSSKAIAIDKRQNKSRL